MDTQSDYPWSNGKLDFSKAGFGVPNVNLPGAGGTQPPKTRFTETSVSCKPLLKCAGFYENSNEKNEGIP